MKRRTFFTATFGVIAASLGVGTAYAHCGACGVDGKHDHKDDAKQMAKAEVGKVAPGFELKAVRTEESHSLDQLIADNDIVILVWQSINCPWDKMRESGGYQRVLSPLAEKWSEKVQFVAINSNKDESVEQVKAYADQHEIPYPILKDPGNVVADAYEAKTTPHFYVITKDDDGQPILRYNGGFEETPTSPEKCGEMDEQHLVPVVDALAAGNEAPYTKEKSKGCGIKREKK